MDFTQLMDLKKYGVIVYVKIQILILNKVIKYQ